MEKKLINQPNLYPIILTIGKWPTLLVGRKPLQKREWRNPCELQKGMLFWPHRGESTWVRGAFAPQLGLWLAVADGCEVLATLDGRVPSCRVSGQWLLNIFHLHFFMMYPKIWGPQVLLAALPFANTVGSPFSREGKEVRRQMWAPLFNGSSSFFSVSASLKQWRK